MRRKYLHILIFFLGNLFACYGQIEKSLPVKIIPQNEIKILYIIGGIAPTLTDSDKKFCEKYQVKFHDFGCVVPANLNDFHEKNYIVFKELTEKFGAHWQQEITKEPVGLKSWLQNQK